MIDVSRGKAKTRPEVLGFEIRHLFENLLSRKSGREKIENVTDANTHPPNAWPAATLFGIYRDSIGKLIHRTSIKVRRAEADARDAKIGITSPADMLRPLATS
jgi:hypothetical protein